MASPLADDDRHSSLVDDSYNVRRSQHAVITRDETASTKLLQSENHFPILVVLRQPGFNLKERPYLQA